MKKRLGCLHAHYSNIEYIERALSIYDIDLMHFVDSSIMYRMTSVGNYDKTEAKKKVKEQLDWIAQCEVDAILITCTNYIALLQDQRMVASVPIIKIDEPYFEYICTLSQPQMLLFTNPATVNGTVERLEKYAEIHQKSLDLEIMIMENTFELIMKGLKEEYNAEIIKVLHQLVQDDQKAISVAQLSMVDAAKRFEQQTSHGMMNPLKIVVTSIVSQLDLQKKS
ncbi:aspartate/glutamate racemase family protein [Peribacillus sp. NPDC097225]|uniref:aspartate/glutamate racemase family protein n=1 Tax=Peribacillus sp. NPDC097225 TaxID=3364400 RepID=UPI00381F5E9A